MKRLPEWKFIFGAFSRVLQGHMVFQEFQDLPGPRAKRCSLGLPPSTDRSVSSRPCNQTSVTACGVCMLSRASVERANLDPEALQALLDLAVLVIVQYVLSFPFTA